MSRPMGIETIAFRGEIYPAFQGSGFAARFAFPFAKEICKGHGLDVGYSQPDWCLPGAIGVDDNKSFLPEENKEIGAVYNAMCLPIQKNNDGWDYIFSSHCLEHLPDWVAALDHWHDRLAHGGVLFLYLPHPDQVYWRPFHNRKHIHSLDPGIIQSYLTSHRSGKHWINVFVSGRDLNHSFTAIAQKV